ARGRITDAYFDIAGRLGFGARADRVLVVVHDADVQVERIDEGRDGAVAAAGQAARFTLVLQFDLDGELFARLGLGRTGDTVPHQFPGRCEFEIFAAEQAVDRVGGDFGPGFVRYPLDGPTELDLKTARQYQAVFL